MIKGIREKKGFCVSVSPKVFNNFFFSCSLRTAAFGRRRQRTSVSHPEVGTKNKRRLQFSCSIHPRRPVEGVTIKTPATCREKKRG